MKGKNPEIISNVRRNKKRPSQKLSWAFFVSLFTSHAFHALLHPSSFIL
jgi:hypothetical protein